jgi:hypothetical protein
VTSLVCSRPCAASAMCCATTHDLFVIPSSWAEHFTLPAP